MTFHPSGVLYRQAFMPHLETLQAEKHQRLLCPALTLGSSSHGLSIPLARGFTTHAVSRQMLCWAGMQKWVASIHRPSLHVRLWWGWTTSLQCTLNTSVWDPPWACQTLPKTEAAKHSSQPGGRTTPSWQSSHSPRHALQSCCAFCKRHDLGYPEH
jgi:hypothetical protein